MIDIFYTMKVWRRLSLPFAVLLFALLLPMAGIGFQPALASTIVVDSGADDDGVGCTLREAVASANLDSSIGGCTAGSEADTIIFSEPLASSTITLSGNQLYLSSTLTIDGGGVITVSGGNESRVIETSDVVTLTGLVIRDGNTTDIGAGINNFGGRLRVENSRVLSNTASTGGGISNEDGQIVLSSVEVRSNTAEVGGGIYSAGDAAILTVMDASLIWQNTADYGGGINNVEGRVIFTASQLVSNTANDAGGGVFNLSGLVELFGASLVSNTGGEGTGGGVHNEKGLTILTSSDVLSNSANFGGGVFNLGESAMLTITNASVLWNNSAFIGGGINNEAGHVLLTSTEVVSNRADSGGGIFNVEGQADLIDVKLISNSGDTGSALLQSNDATTDITNSCIVGNRNTAVVHDGGDTITATDNWWGSSSGPGGNGTGTGDLISADVTFEPFKVEPILDCPALPPAVLGIEKSVNNGTPVVGDIITYTVVITNSGKGNATGAIISDTLPSGLTFVAGSTKLEPPAAGMSGNAPNLVTDLMIVASSSVTVSYQANVTESGSFTNTVQVLAVEVSSLSDSIVIVATSEAVKEYSVFLSFITRE